MAPSSYPTDEPPSKRVKPNTEKDEDYTVDEDSLLHLMEGDEINEEKEAARQRRLLRRQRWSQSAAETTQSSVNNVQQEPPMTTEEQEQVSVMEADLEDTFQDATKKEEEDVDDFDMFSSSVSPVVVDTKETTKNTKKDDFDDDEGYYKPVLGETIDCGTNKFKVMGIVGKGVFSTVLQAKDVDSQQQVALKLIRNNETMAKAALMEIRILKKLSAHPHVVQLLHPTEQHVPEHHSHVVMCFDYQPYNLRDVLQKFGRGVGISLHSIQLYFPQLLSALRHLELHSILHSDLKPDNILVSSDFGTLQICDFGSATLLSETSMIPTPYLVSRFYRAPEIILGSVPSYPIDLWSAAVTVVELFLGKVLFHGTTNNDMILIMMQILGPFSSKQMKQHILNCKTHPGLPCQFQDGYFLQQDVDKATGTLVKKQVSLQDFPTKPLQSLLLKAKSPSDSRVLVLKFANLLKSCLALDPSRRIDLRSAMHHEFFQTSSKVKDKEQG